MSGIRLILRLKLFVSNGLFVTSWRTSLSCDCVKGGEEDLGLDECRLKMMSGVALPLWVEVLMLL